MRLFGTLLLCFVFFNIALQAQEEEQTDSTASNWEYEVIAGMNLSQVMLENWTQGGDNSLAYTAVGEMSAVLSDSPWVFSNTFDIAYGRTKLGDDEFRTNENEFRFENVLSYDFGWALNLMASNTVQSVITDGYDYSEEPFKKTATFWDPGYITQSIGMIYDDKEMFSSRLGVGFKETFASTFTQYTDDTETADVETFKFDTGIESVSKLELSVADNLKFTSKLRLFGRFDNLEVWDVRFDNTLVAKVNDYVNVNLNILVVYDLLQSPKTQLKEALMLGLRYQLF